jgi:chemotaxis protein CheC
MLTEQQLDTLTVVLQQGADGASSALSLWVGRAAGIVMQRVGQLEMADAVALLGDADELIVACVMTIKGRLTGILILAFDDASGWSLTDLLLNLSTESTSAWDEIARSAVLETTNIVGCAYLNSLSRLLKNLGEPPELLPSPPQFVRDFAASLLQSSLLNQAASSSTIFLTETSFHLEGTRANWKLLFVPDAESLPVLRRMLM